MYLFISANRDPLFTLVVHTLKFEILQTTFEPLAEPQELNHISVNDILATTFQVIYTTYIVQQFKLHHPKINKFIVSSYE